jgi:hypothetical protein
MALPVAALFLAASALRTVGNIKANFDQAYEEERNAREMRIQKDYADFVKKQELQLVNRKYAHLYGSQATSYASSGVDAGTGSAAMTLGDAIYSATEEAYRVSRRYDEEIRMLDAKVDRSGRLSSNLRDPLTNLLQIGTGTLDALGSYALGSGTTHIGAGPQGSTRR